jgi:four helix bundle protein
MKNFKTLDLAVEFYDLSQELKLSSHLKDQMNRAASSIALNLAEGNAKFSVKDKKRIYQIALGSLRECQAILMLLKKSEEPINKKADHLAACIYKLSTQTPKELEEIK